MTPPEYSIDLVTESGTVCLILGAGETEARFSDYELDEPRTFDPPKP